MRKLSDQFMYDLQEGFLAPLLQRVKADHTLCLEIRKDYINVYYRGGNLLKLGEIDNGYEAEFDEEFFKYDNSRSTPKRPSKFLTVTDVNDWVDSIPLFKQAMDLHHGKEPKEEREAQQLILRDNNFGGGVYEKGKTKFKNSAVCRKTDFYICDMEVEIEGTEDPKMSIFDMVAVHWPANGKDRKKRDNRRLVFIEVKHGDKSYKDESGIMAHIEDVNRLCGASANLQTFKEDMISVFNQKRDLGLINCEKDLVSFSEEKPVLVFILINHKPRGKVLREILGSITPSHSPHADLYIASSSFMGYGLYDQAVFPINEALEKFKALI